MSNIPDDLRKLIDEFVNLKKTLDAAQQLDDALYLDADVCPDGLEPCDAQIEICPDEKYAPKPPMYTFSGARCFEKESIAFARQTKKSMDDMLQVNLREFVTQAATLISKIREDVPQIPCNKLTIPALCGINCTWDEAKGKCYQRDVENNNDQKPLNTIEVVNLLWQTKNLDLLREAFRNRGRNINIDVEGLTEWLSISDENRMKTRMQRMIHDINDDAAKVVFEYINEDDNIEYNEILNILTKCVNLMGLSEEETERLINVHFNVKSEDKGDLMDMIDRFLRNAINAVDLNIT